MRSRLILLLLSLCLTNRISRAQSPRLPDAPALSDAPERASAPAPTHLILMASLPSMAPLPSLKSSSSSSTPFADPSSFAFSTSLDPSADTAPLPQTLNMVHSATPHKPGPAVPQDANGNPIPLNHREPTRILGFIPNFRSVSVGAKPPPPGWKYNFDIATHQSFDYSSFFFLGLTSLFAEGINEHPSMGKGVDGYYAYTWRGFIDKTDGTYLSAWLLPSLLHEDNRYYPLGDGHSILFRSLYVISRQAVARDYSGHSTPNIANLGGKVLTQVISQYYYPDGTSGFGVLAEKFGYSIMRDVGFSAIREFYPNVAGHYVRLHHEKQARQAARDAQSNPATP